MEETIKPKLVANMTNSATGISPKEDTPCYGYQVTKCCEIRLACNA